MPRPTKTYQSEYERGKRAADALITEWMYGTGYPSDYLDKHLDVAIKCAESPIKTELERAFHEGYAAYLRGAIEMVDGLLDILHGKEPDND